jgi:aminoglycoside phosphotransferase
VTLLADFLDRHRERLAACDLPAPDALECTLLTPRFRASRHVVFVLVRKADATPALVAKIARLAHDREISDREARNLAAAHAASRDATASIPRLIACEVFREHAVLLESAIAGAAIDPAAIRAEPDRRVRAVCDWLAGFQRDHRAANETARPIDANLDATFAILERSLADPALQQLLAWTREQTEPLRGAVLQAFEHGDLSHPNLLEQGDGGVGVLDWELADPEGVPAADLFFFLAYAGCSLARATSVAEQRRAFHRTFFAPNHRVSEVCASYAAALDLDREALRALFAFSWARSVANFLVRLDAGSTPDPSSSTAAHWLGDHRYTAFWRDTLEHREALLP